MALRKHGVGEVLGTDNDATDLAKTATSTWTQADQEALEAENREEEEV